MVTIALNKPGAFSHKIEFPSSWDELSTSEMELVSVEVMAQRQNQAINKAYIFTGLIEKRAAEQKIKLPADWKSNLNYEQAASAGFDAIDFIFSSNTRTINPYPALKSGKFKTFNGPDDDFNSMTCGEFEDSQFMFFQFNQTSDISHIAKLTSILWREKGKSYEAKDDKRVEFFKKLPVEQLFSILIWYSGCLDRLGLFFPNVFKKDSNGSPDPNAFTNCIHYGAGPKNGTRENIRKMLLKEFLYDMELEAKTMKEHAESK